MPPTITPEGQSAKNRIAEFRQNINNGATSAQARANVQAVEAVPRPRVEPKVSAPDLTNPVSAPTLTTPPSPTIPPRVGNTVNNVLGSIRSQSETARRLQEEQQAFQTFADQSSGFDIQNKQLERFGVTPDKLKS